MLPTSLTDKELTRLWFFELLAYWEGEVNATHVANQFGLSVTQARTTTDKYQTLAPHNLSYSSSQKCFTPTAHFVPLLISQRVDDYLTWLSTGSLQCSAPHVAHLLHLPSRTIAPAVMRGLVAGIKQGQRVEVDYVSLTNPNGQGRVIAPHSFIKTNQRWHVRAYCEKSQDYRDFVLSRFRGQPELLGKSAFNASQDAAWNTPVTLILQPDSRLHADKRAVIEQDYQMQNGQLCITTKGCLVNYLLRELQVNTKMLEVNPEAQQLVRVNFADVSSALACNAKRWSRSSFERS